MARQHKIKIRQSPKNKQFYVSIVAANGEPLFDGCEGHLKKKTHQVAIEKLVAAIKSDNIKIVDETEAPVSKKGKLIKMTEKKVGPKVTLRKPAKAKGTVQVPGPITPQ